MGGAVENPSIDLNAWISIDSAGKVTITNHRAEMGQGSFQSVPQIIAEELEVNLDQINIVFAQGNGRKYGSQVTGGSSTIRGSYKKLLKLSATAREMLTEAAAKKWGVNKSECYAENGVVFHKASGKKLGYGELVADASKLEMPKDVKLKDPKYYKIIRKGLARQDTPLKTNGTAIFGLDKKLPGMLYAVVERNPRFAGKVKSFDDSETKKVPGVKHVLKVNRDVFDNMYEGVAVVATNTWAAMQGRKVLKVEWDDSGFEHHSTEQLYAKMKEQLKGDFINFKSKGNFNAAYNKADKKLEALYETPYESAMISKEIKAPVMVVWTREDDMTMGPYRPGMVYQCKAGLGKNGNIAAFETKMAGQNMGTQNPGADKSGYNDSVTEGLLEPYFEAFPHYSFGDSPLESPIPVMWWRSVYASTNAFALESFIDELAVSAGKDPLEFRRQHLGNPRYLDLITKLEEVSGWKNRGKNEGYGVAVTECFTSIVGEAVKVSKKPDGKVKIDKVWAVMDCGWYVNPNIISAQVEGSIVMALGAATKHASHFADGKAVEKNFNTYEMPRITDIGEIEVHVMDNEEKAGGVGEPGLPQFTPALTNAIFDLTGKRIRVLPFNLEEV